MKIPSLKNAHLGRLLHYGKNIRPLRDWFILLGLFTFALVISVIWNVVLFMRVTNGQQVGTAAPAPVVAPLNLSGVRTLFDARAQEQARYAGTYRFVDPSL